MPKPKKPKTEAWRNPFEEASKQMAEMMQKALERINTPIFGELIPSPELAGWLKLMSLLTEASQDKEVMGSPQAIALVEMLLELVGELDVNSTADDAFKPLAPKFVSSNAKDMISNRFEKERGFKEWIISEWIEHQNEFGGNKSRFARKYINILMEKHGRVFTVRTVTEKWLKDV